MALSTATITFNVEDMTGVKFDARRTKVWLTTNVPNDTIIDKGAKKIRLGSGNITINPDGTGSAQVWIPGPDANPRTWQTTFHVDYPDRNRREQRVQRHFGPFTITGNADLANLVDEQAVPPTYITQVTQQLDAKVAQATSSVAGATAAAVAAAAQAQAAAQAAESVVVTDLGTTDAQSAALIRANGSQTSAALSASIAGVVESLVPIGPAGPGRLWGFLGDSLTEGVGSGGPNVVDKARSYPPQAIKLAGQLVARRDSIEAGVSGQTTAQILARADGLLDQGVEALVVMAGTNDVLLPLVDAIANVMAIIEKAHRRGVPVVMCTIPPRNTTTSLAGKRWIAAFNLWVTTTAPRLGCEVADVYAAVADPATGAYVPELTNDWIHPTPAGYRRIALAIAAAMRRTVKTDTASLVAAVVPSVNLIADPLNARANVLDGGWYVDGGLLAPTYSMVDDETGFLPAGRWAQYEIDGAAGAGFKQVCPPYIPAATNYAGGDLLAFLGYAQIRVSTGDWETAAVTQTGSLRLAMLTAGGTELVSDDFVGYPSGTPGIYNVGPFILPFRVPVGGTANLVGRTRLTVPAGVRAAARLGALGFFNLTALGIESIAPSATMRQVP